MVKQRAVRTRPSSSETVYYLDGLLQEGYKVIYCTPIGEELEYILELKLDKEENNENRS